jgi:hypothetical protein
MQIKTIGAVAAVALVAFAVDVFVKPFVSLRTGLPTGPATGAPPPPITLSES